MTRTRHKSDASADVQAETGARLRELVRDGDRIFIGTGAGEPGALVRTLVDEVLPHRREVELLQVAIGGREEVVEYPDGRGHRLRLVAGGGRGNQALREGRALGVPASMGTLEEQISSGALRVDGALVAGTDPVDGGPGSVGPGLSLDLGRSACAAARFRALELNHAMPRVRSVEWLRLADCDLVVPTKTAPPAARPSTVNDAQRRIGSLVADLVRPHTALELGVGRGLTGVAQALAERGPGLSLTIHTGMITDDTRLLVERGVVDGPSPSDPEASVVATVALGTEAFYHWLDRNPAVTFVDSSRAHQLAHLAQLDAFLAINSAAQVDLVGNVGALSWGGSLGGGGLPDFATAGAHSRGSVIALESRGKHGRSRIVPQAAHVQLHGSLVTHVVTEYGVAHLRGLDSRMRAERIIAIAHPDDRPRLAAEAALLGGGE
ncbi:acetyl-CoA hydrolase/transferase C-terminal domain-containing protein [Nocardioides humi]|uniref:Acetyl-CoA hydrolase/transferase C-terminal domain-containing protein n=1 Tax=Nocardioides humi TaxID=449461 RepID=A0ABN1ZW63_9ACTN|nr:acetyl-CoA hydrolase/transferase C-terminal domain-containing protein [Nocardioides humi]